MTSVATSGIAPVFSSDLLARNKAGQKDDWLHSIFNKSNRMVLMQSCATGAMALSGWLSGNHGRMVTGIGNTIKNTSWLGLNFFTAQTSQDPFDRDLRSATSNSIGAGVSAVVNSPQLVMNLGPVFAGAAAGVAWGDIIGATAGIVAYTLMASDYIIERRRLKKFEELGSQAFPDNPDIWHAYDKGRRDLVVGYSERGHHFQDFVFNRLPSLLLITRGLSFTATGVAAAAASFTLPAVLMVGAGLLFTFGALSEHQKQNGHISPIKEEEKDAKALLDRLTVEGAEKDQANGEPQSQGQRDDNFSGPDDQYQEKFRHLTNADGTGQTSLSGEDEKNLMHLIDARQNNGSESLWAGPRGMA